MGVESGGQDGRPDSGFGTKPVPSNINNSTSRRRLEEEEKVEEKKVIEEKRTNLVSKFVETFNSISIKQSSAMEEERLEDSNTRMITDYRSSTTNSESDSESNAKRRELSTSSTATSFQQQSTITSTNTKIQQIKLPIEAKGTIYTKSEYFNSHEQVMRFCNSLSIMNKT